MCAGKAGGGKTQNESARMIHWKRLDIAQRRFFFFSEEDLKQFYCSPEENDKYTNAPCWSHGGGAHMLGLRV